MARARNIKPGFYKNEDLAECSVWARLIFPGLWMLADREGRLEDRPKRIKAELLPFDDGNMDDLLQELHDRKFLVRYQNSDGRFIQISKFLEHQSPHYSEKPSVIMPPSLPELSKNSSETYDEEIPGAHQEDSARDGPIKVGSQPPSSLNPSSLNPESLSTPLSEPPAQPSIADCPQQALLGLYAKHLPMLTQPRVWDGARPELMRKRWRYCSMPNGIGSGYQSIEEGLAFWERFFAYVAKQSKLTEGIPRADGSCWRPDLPWLLKAENFAKVIEGKYER